MVGWSVSVEFHIKTVRESFENYVIDYCRSSSYWPIWGGAGFGLAGFSPGFYVLPGYDKLGLYVLPGYDFSF